jgi:hypothetical protein
LLYASLLLIFIIKITNKAGLLYAGQSPSGLRRRQRQAKVKIRIKIKQACFSRALFALLLSLPDPHEPLPHCPSAVARLARVARVARAGGQEQKEGSDFVKQNKAGQKVARL